MLLGGVVLIGSLGVGFAMLVEYKPWGVPDVLREEYDIKVAEINHRNNLIHELNEREKPVLAIRQNQHVGFVDPLATVEHAFEIRNDGQLPLRLEFRDLSAGVEAELEKNTVAPNETSRAKISWNTGDQAGEFEVQATLVTNDPLKEQVVVKLAGEVKSMLVLPKSISFEQADITKRAEAKFVAYSQVSEDLQIVDVECDREDFDWHAEPISIGDPNLEAKSAWLVRVWTTCMEYGKYSGTIKVVVKPDAKTQKEVAQELTFKGKVRSPVNFYSPEIHKSDGLDIGTLIAGEEHQFHLLVRLRGDLEREISVLDVEPDELQASLAPLTTKGDYRLTLTVPADCPMVVFNKSQQHGYVEVGDPQDKYFGNWFPLHGAVVELEK